ncbi:transcriptional regulator [Lutibacter profundi]|uniref:Transcriptional regulator n=1 Tax=Lutibacter profundi TaxID=1622118 RepID=A0A0X8G6D6_9FLAO|nr:Crp/Fnr family transcriptional regulator [Lutibacter profundi]AMC10896.1 transcriptional regulator [Lutibacter profundi]
MDNKIWYLEEVNLFKIICPHYYADYKESHEFDSYSKKEFIYFTDEPSTKVYLIDKGKVKIAYYTDEGNEVVKAILSKGEIFGEKTILGETKHNEFAQSIEKNTSICSISVGELENLMLENRNLSLKLYKFIGLRMKRLERRLEIILFKDVRKRTIEFIQELKDEYGKELLNGEILIKHPYSQKEIATLIGTSRPSLNIILNNLKEEGYLSFNGKEIILKKFKSVR